MKIESWWQLPVEGTKRVKASSAFGLHVILTAYLRNTIKKGTKERLMRKKKEKGKIVY